MFANIIGALLPTVVTLLLGFLAGWHHDFDTKQASVLNSMVMLYALPLSLFAGMVGMSRDQVLSQGPLAFALFLAWPAATQSSSSFRIISSGAI